MKLSKSLSSTSAAAAALRLARPPPAPPLAVHRRRCALLALRPRLPPLLRLCPLLLLHFTWQGRPRPAIHTASPASNGWGARHCG